MGAKQEGMVLATPDTGHVTEGGAIQEHTEALYLGSVVASDKSSQSS